MFLSFNDDPRLKKLSWGACMALSFVYFFLFYQTATQADDPPYGQGMTDGFCVWDFPPPHDKEDECDPVNSHRISWWEDFLMTAIAILLLGLRVKKDGWNKTTGTLFLGSAAVILFHGILHAWISSMHCFLPIGGSQAVQNWGMFFYAAFTFMLCLVLFAFGLPEMKRNYLWAGAIALLTLFITKSITPEYSLSTLFAISHPLSSVVGFFSTSGYLSWPVAVVFFFATLAGVIELVACDSFELAVGGHV